MHSNEESVKSLKCKKPNPVLYRILMVVMKLLKYKQYGVEITRKVDPNKYKGKPVIVVSNHASRCDYLFVGFAMGGRPINFIAAQNEFLRDHLAFILRLMHVIPKKNFVPDLQTIRFSSKIIKQNGCVCLFPEGMNSISGAQQPVAIGTGKFLKHYGVPVLQVKIKGGFLTNPKFCLDERYGKICVELDELFTPEQLSQMSEEEIETKLNEANYHNDYEWNKAARNKYDCHGHPAHNLHQLLYRCPKCGTEFHMKGEGYEIKCLACGNGATLDDTYDFKPLPGSEVPADPVRWFEDERRFVRKQVEDESFTLREHVTLGAIPDDRYMKDMKNCETVGEGMLTLDRRGLSFDGTRDNKEYHVFIASKNLPTVGMNLDVSFFYTYASGEFLQFTPDGETTVKWLQCIEEVHRVNGGKWQNFPFFDYEI